MNCSNKILFVDDEDTILAGFQLTLGRSFEIFVSSSVTDALEVFKEQGPFAAVVSDFQMPIMNGAEFLQKIRELDKEVVTMLLTGAANFENVSEAVHRGQIFRLLGKPCPAEKMKEHIEAALRQYQLIRAEKDMLEQTLNGAIRAMTSILAASKPLFFGRAQRVKDIAFKLADLLDVDDPWRLELAATFSYLGHVGLPDNIQEDVYKQNDLPSEVKDIMAGFPMFISGLLGGIPRLDDIPEIIKFMSADYNAQEVDKSGIRKLASILRFSQQYDHYASEGRSNAKIREVLSSSQGKYIPGIIGAFTQAFSISADGDYVDMVDPKLLVEGMEINQDLRLPDKTLIAPKGTLVEAHFMRILDNYFATYDENPFPDAIQVLVRKKQE
jgi:response regulator RpfG family c-di-GMP phosphodiesterase